jgi:threonine dehydrogenase-like Zn-dependent dehydrogenase
MILRLRGLEVVTFGRTPSPYLNSMLAEELGARYISTKDVPLKDASRMYGPFDIIFEGTGSSAVVFEAAEVLAKNGVLILASITGAGKKLEIPADKINLDFVLGNKVMFGTVNANREYFEAGVKDLAQCKAQFPGWANKLLTHPVEGLENFQQMMDLLTTAKGAIKVYVDVSSETASGKQMKRRVAEPMMA